MRTFTYRSSGIEKGGVARARGIGFYNLGVFGEVGVMCAAGGVHRQMIGLGDNMVEVVTSLCGI